jgi:prepilin-type N-terminal cleavage/methylation domain-containing protein
MEFSSKNTPKGFTIVELLIVIVVIGILAAITIVAYNGVQGRANDTNVQADLNNFAKRLGIYHAENGSYPVTLSLALGIKFSRESYSTAQNNLYYCADSAGAGYSMTVMSKSGKMYVVSSANGLAVYTGGWGGSTTCTVNGFATGDFRSHGYNIATTPNWQGWVAN